MNEATSGQPAQRQTLQMFQSHTHCSITASERCSMSKIDNMGKDDVKELKASVQRFRMNKPSEFKSFP